MTNQVEFFVKMRELLYSLRHASHHSLFVCNNVLLSRIAYVVFVAIWMHPPIILLQTLQLSFPCVLHAILSSENCYSPKNHISLYGAYIYCNLFSEEGSIV